MSGCQSCDGHPAGCMDCIDESKLDLRPAPVKVRVPTSEDDPHILKLRLADALNILRSEMAAHDATRARLGKLEEFVRDMLFMLDKCPVGLDDDWDDHRFDRKVRFEGYAR